MSIEVMKVVLEHLERVMSHGSSVQAAKRLLQQALEQAEKQERKSKEDDEALLRVCLEAMNRSDYLGWQLNIPIIKDLRKRLGETS